MKRILFILVFIILLPGCSHKISLEDEKSKILDVAQELVINKSKEEHSVIDSFEVYDVLKQRGEILLFYSTYIERGSMGKETRGFWLRGVEKDKSGYKLTGGGGTSGTVTDNPVELVVMVTTSMVQLMIRISR